jgi:hypothetical protein
MGGVIARRDYTNVNRLPFESYTARDESVYTVYKLIHRAPYVTFLFQF